MTHTFFVGEHGFVKLVDQMPLTNIDQSIVDAARVSYDSGSTKHTSSPEGLIRYLMRHWHTTPFEMAEFKFHIKMPLFVARQHLRHRTASVNEVSARYSVVKDEFMVPDEFRTQAEVNKQGSLGPLQKSENDTAVSLSSSTMHACHMAYEALLEMGACREQSRMVLPQSMYTEFYWKIDLHNLMHYLHLRMDSHAQKEIRDYADAIYKLVEPQAPLTMKAFRDFRVNAINITGPEISCLRKMLKETEEVPQGDLSKGEFREFKNKILQIINGSPGQDS